MMAMACIFLSLAKEKANGAFGIGHTKNQERWGWGFPRLSGDMVVKQVFTNKGEYND